MCLNDDEKNSSSDLKYIEPKLNVIQLLECN
jgi:hypothetical protein